MDSIELRYAKEFSIPHHLMDALSPVKSELDFIWRKYIQSHIWNSVNSEVFQLHLAIDSTLRTFIKDLENKHEKHAIADLYLSRASGLTMRKLLRDCLQVRSVLLKIAADAQKQFDEKGDALLRSGPKSKLAYTDLILELTTLLRGRVPKYKSALADLIRFQSQFDHRLAFHAVGLCNSSDPDDVIKKIVKRSFSSRGQVPLTSPKCVSSLPARMHVASSLKEDT